MDGEFFRLQLLRLQIQKTAQKEARAEHMCIVDRQAHATPLTAHPGGHGSFQNVMVSQVTC